MRLTLATHRLGRGGSESYLVSVGSELQRLGHSVTIHAVHDGPGGERARSLGIDVAIGEDPVLEKPDVILAQDAGRSYALAERFAGVPQVFVAHSELFDAQLPPQEADLVAGVVALNDRIERRLQALATPPAVVRLRQPIDTERFAARETIREQPRRAVVLSNYLYGERLAVLRAAWAPAGVEVVAIGDEGRPADAPELEIADADIVVGKGRALLEGMSSARAAYVLDMAGCDGWVTPASYASLEADGFAGQATGRHASIDSLRTDLDRYRPEMGPANRDLVTAHHGLRRHVEELTGLMRTAIGGRPALDGLSELARTVRSNWRLEDRAADLARENDRLHARIVELEAEARALRATRRYRVAAAVGRPLDNLRRRTS